MHLYSSFSLSPPPHTRVLAVSNFDFSNILGDHASLKDSCNNFLSWEMCRDSHSYHSSVEDKKDKDWDVLNTFTFKSFFVNIKESKTHVFYAFYLKAKKYFCKKRK